MQLHQIVTLLLTDNHKHINIKTDTKENDSS